MSFKSFLFCWVLRKRGVASYISTRDFYKRITSLKITVKKKVKPRSETYYIIPVAFPINGLAAIIRHFVFSYSELKREGYLPVLDLEPQNVLNAEQFGLADYWGSMFQQNISIKEALKKDHIIGGFKFDYTLMDDVNGQHKVDRIDLLPGKSGRLYYRTVNAILKECCRLRSDIQDEFDARLEVLFSGKERVLGVMLREDFSQEVRNIQTHISNIKDLEVHPISPSFRDTIDQIKRLYDEWGCDSIFVSSRYQNSILAFREVFGNNVLYFERKREAYYVDLDQEDLCEEGRFDADENGLLYFRDIYALSKCSCFVGHICGGSQLSLVLNAGQYKKVFIFDNLNKRSGSYSK